MDGEATNLPALTKDHNLTRPINNNPDPNLHHRSFNTTSSSSSSSFSSSPPDFLRNVQAAFKRHRPLGVVQSNSIRPRRLLVSQRETSKVSRSIMGSVGDTRNTLDEVSLNQKVQDSTAWTKNMMSVVAETQADAAITPPSILGTIRGTNEKSLQPIEAQSDRPSFRTGCNNNDPMASSLIESEHVPGVDGSKKVQFAMENNARPQGVDDHMATGTDNLSTYMSSLALTEMEWDVSNQLESSTVMCQDVKNHRSENLDLDISLRSDGGISALLANRSTGVQDQLNQFRNFIQSDFSHHMTQSSVVGSSCATTTLVNLASAPMLSSTSYCITPHQNSNAHFGVDCDLNCQPVPQRDVEHSSHLLSQNTSRVLHDHTDVAAQALNSAVGTHIQEKSYGLPEGLQGIEPKECRVQKDPPHSADKSTKGELFVGDVTDVQSQAPMSRYQSSDVKSVSSKSETQKKQEKPASSKAASAPRKRSYDPDLFFKVNGKLYQRLGKIGSGGSSEVHKVISQDCTIYALKKIKLKGRDYATAFGFCQEIEYLNKLKGKNHIIQLIDYEVTDKTLLKEVMNGSMSNKDGRVRDDAYIYMVLEYGEIDLAHMLSQKWKELDSSQSTIDENWLRFYWQQILLAVNTIHEERIVHSDLKPANFLLVKGSLKLIDFGIAKAIMSDTTNIQRDSQVGTLSYMSPEAFMCNETDANGNTIKCGRPSDIWSLGCILYQMVYGRTPFAEYKTFWAKFKVITDPTYEITYEPLSNLWLLDLMKKCLAWDRNERWRIPQLLQHPFLVPPVTPHLFTPADQGCKFFQLVTESCSDDPNVLMLYSQLLQLLKDTIPETASQVLISREQRCKLLIEMSNLCLQLQEKL